MNALKTIFKLGLIVGLIFVTAHHLQLWNFSPQSFEQQLLYAASNASIPGSIFPASVSQTAEQAAAKVTPSVVSIYGTEDVAPQNSSQARGNNSDPWVHAFSQTITVTAGTGFFINSDGYILTNKHVVAADESYAVILSGGRRISGNVVYRDPNNDLAILKISGSGYPALTLADSSLIKTGELVLGLGNAYGKYADTLSAGSITSLHRTIQPEESGQELTDIIQTSAQLYPGDSGGPLFNSSGQVVGINVAAAVNRADTSFSIPIDQARSIIQSYAQ